MTAAAILFSERDLAWIAPRIAESGGITVRVADALIAEHPTDSARPMQETNTTTVESAEIDSAVSWLPDALKKLAQLRGIGADWHSCDAAPPNETAIKTSIYVLQKLSRFDLRPDLISPSTDEAVCISFKGRDKYADIECYNSGEVLAMTANGRERPKIWEVPRACLDATIIEIDNFITG
jgi:hypothetical protein